MASGQDRRARFDRNPNMPMLRLLGGGGMLGDAPPENPIDPNPVKLGPPPPSGDTPPQYPIDPNPKPPPQVGDAPPLYPTDPQSKWGQSAQMDGNGVIKGQRRPWYSALMTNQGNA